MSDMSSSLSGASPNQVLASSFFLQGDAESLFPADLTRSPEWDVFARGWEDLRQDEYMADGGKYRLRRYSEFSLDPVARVFSVLAHRPYRQSKEDNYLNGGIDRLYAPMQQDIQKNPCFAEVLFCCADVLPTLPTSAYWFVQVFQNRILATPDQQGKPTPEGVHRDGVDYVLTLMIGRHNVVGGESTTYAQDGKTLLASVTLAKPGDFILLNDSMTKHEVGPIRRHDAADSGYRDALIAMFTQRAGASPVPA